jgi:hypothetical protein
VPPRSHPSVSKLIMPRLLWPNAGISSFGPTLCRLTARGTAMPCSFPSVLIHMQRALWMWPAIIRTVRRGAPGTVAPHSSWGKCSTRKTVTRLLVLHAASSISRGSSAGCITTLQKMIKLTLNSAGSLLSASPCDGYITVELRIEISQSQHHQNRTLPTGSPS